MDIAPVGTIHISRTCGEIPCGQCPECLRQAMLHTSSFVYRNVEKGGREAALAELLACLGLHQQRVPSSEK